MFSQNERFVADSLLNLIPLEIKSENDLNAVIQFGIENQIGSNGNTFDKRKHIIKFRNAIEYAKRTQDKRGILDAKFALFKFYIFVYDIPLIIQTGNELLEFDEDLSVDQNIKIIVSLHVVYTDLEAYNEIVKLLPFLDKYLYSTKGRSGRLKRKTTELAWAYYNTNNYEKAAQQFLQDADFLDQNNYSKVHVASMINNAGLSYASMGSRQKALDMYESALLKLDEAEPSAEFVNSKEYLLFFREVINGSIAELDLKNNKAKDALPVFLNLVRLSKLPEVIDSFKLHQSYYFLGVTYSYLNEPELSLRYLDSAMAYTVKSTPMRIDLLEQRGKTLLQLEENADAIKTFQRAETLSDSIIQIQVARDNMIAQAKFFSEEKEKELNVIKEEIVEKTRLNKYQWYTIIITLILLLIIGYSYYRTRKDNKLISRQKSKLEASVTVKEILLKEIHHRVKNNLQVITGLLQLQSKKTNSPTMKVLLEDSQRQVNSMALVHEMLYQQEDHATVPMNNYLEKLTNQQLFSLSGSFIEARHKVENDIELSINKAIPLGLMLSELLTNTSKYAYNDDAGQVEISLVKKSGELYNFTYKDFGKGLPEGYENSVGETLGFRLLGMLAEEMNAVMKIDGNHGMKLEIEFEDIT